MRKTRFLLLLGYVFLFCVGLAAFFWLINVLEPNLTDGRYRIEGQEWESFEHPLDFRSDDGTMVDVEMTMHVARVHASRFRFVPDDCVEELTVNGIPVEDDAIPFCDYTKGKTIDLKPFLRAGENVVQVRIKNNGGPGKLVIEKSMRDPWILGAYTFLFVLILAFSAALWKTLRPRKEWLWVYALLIFGIILRLIYLLNTSYTVRAHDVDGHIEYINYFVQHWFLPSAKEGWEFYHPPLYYFVSALWMRFGELVGRSNAQLIEDLQIEACLISIGVLVTCVWIGSMLFKVKKERGKFLAFLGTLAVLPGFILFAARINNDVFVYAFSFLFLGFLLHWWRSGKDNVFWFLSLLMAALGMLTKSNAILLVPVAFLCLALKYKIPWRKKILMGAAGLTILLVLTGWFYGLRFLVEKNTHIVQNLTNLHSGLRVDHSLETLTEFNPVRLVKYPYNNAWSDEAGRAYFWEYFYRAAFFGEFGFDEKLKIVSSIILFISLLMIPFAIAGLWRSIRTKWRETLPLWVTALILLAGHIAYRQDAPYSSSQDFRYSILVIIPIAYFFAVGLDALPKRFRWIGYVIVSLFVIACAAFIIALPFVE